MVAVRHNLFFGPRDREFWARIIEERTNLFGADGYYLSVILSQDRDPYYNEPTANRVAIRRVAIKLFIAIERIEEPSTIERGLDLESRITVFITTEQLRANKILPKEGDVIEIWNKQFNVVDTEPMSVFGNQGTNLLSEAPTLYWRFALIRRTEAIPERQVKENI